MKKILVSMHYMELGGAEAALLGLLQSVDPKRAEVDVMIYDHRGELMRYISEECGVRSVECQIVPRFRLLPEVEAYTMLERPIKEVVRKGYWGIALGRLLARFAYQRDMKNNREGLDNIATYHFIAEKVVRFLPRIESQKEYDLAISFLLPHQYVRAKVRAKKYLAWLHTDYSKVYVSDQEERVWARYDYIGAISEDVGKGFAKRFPALENKIVPIENILSAEFIRQRSQEPCPVFENDLSLKLLTIGRYSYPKKMEDIPFLCRRLRDELKGNNEKLKVPSAGEIVKDIKWYIIGYGSPEIEQQVRDEICKEGMEEHVILLGKQTNPYPYIRTCDIYVQPSRYEGKSITVREAQILCKPVIVTHYPTATSQIGPTLSLPRREGTLVGQDGVIVPLEREACAKAMIEVLKDKELLNSLSKYLAEHDYGNEAEIEKIYKLCE